MTLVDSADSILMLYSYAGFPTTNKWSLIKRRDETEINNLEGGNNVGPASHSFDIGDRRVNQNDATSILPSPELRNDKEVESSMKLGTEGSPNIAVYTGTPEESRMVEGEVVDRQNNLKFYTMSNLSIALTIISILVAFRYEISSAFIDLSFTGFFSISIITIMGLIGERCSQCQEAAQRGDGGGLAGSWWRGWAKVYFLSLHLEILSSLLIPKANDNSGFIGAGIVGVFVILVLGWYTIRWVIKQWKRRGTSPSVEGEMKQPRNP